MSSPAPGGRGAPVWAIDANVILRFLLRDDDALYARAANIFESLAEGRVQICCDPVTLAEVVWVLDSFYELPRAEIARELAAMVRAPGFSIVEKSRYLRALELYGDTVKHFGDACACAAALETSEGRLYSFDRELTDVPGVQRSEESPEAGGAL